MVDPKFYHPVKYWKQPRDLLEERFEADPSVPEHPQNRCMPEQMMPSMPGKKHIRNTQGAAMMEEHLEADPTMPDT